MMNWWSKSLSPIRPIRRFGASIRRLQSKKSRPQLETLEDRSVPAGLSGMMNPTYVISPGGGGGIGSDAGGGVAGAFTPSQIRHAYGFDQVSFGATPADGTGTTIAIVDAYNEPNIVSDLATFDSFFGLQAPPSFKVVNQSGGSTLPANNTGWGLEIALDVEWAHAIAPNANILLVEANSSSGTDLYTADKYAAGVAGVVVVSNSWGGGEYSGEIGSDTTFTTPNGHPGVTFLFSAGDSGAPASYPSASPNVVSVGGTRLIVDNSFNITSESAWTGGGGGISAYESQPSYQAGVVPPSMSTVAGKAYRTTPDVAYDSDPNTGFPVYDSFGYNWVQVGGTSDAAPQWAALIAIADEGRAIAGGPSLDGPSGTLPILYALPQSFYHDITSGSSTGSPHEPAVAGYDLATGRGSPVANLIIPALVSPGPALSNIESTPLAFTAGNPAANITSTLSLVDYQSTTISSATVSITGNFSAGEDVLSFVNQNGITGSYNAATGVLTLTGSSSLANYQAAMRSVKYSDFSANPSTATRTVTFQVNDGKSWDNISNTQSRQITVALHVAPVLANIESTTLAYEVGQGTTPITNTLTVTDSDSATIASATVTISANFSSGEDVLGFVNQAGITGSFNSGTGVLTLTGVASVAAYQTALRSVTYVDNSLTPSSLTRTVTFQVNDGFSNNAASNTQSRNISVTLHVAPVLSNIESTALAYTAGQAPTPVTGTMTVTDSDSTTISSATAWISAGLVNTEDVLGFVNQNGISGSYNALTGVLMLTGTSSVANYQTALQSVTYSDTNLLPVAGTRTVTFQVNDGDLYHGVSNTQSRNIGVTDHVAPVLSNIESSTLPYTSGQGPVAITGSLTVADSDSATIAGATVAITSNYISTEDVLGFVNQNGISGSFNSGTGVLTLTGVSSVANYQAALQSVTYTDSNPSASPLVRTVTFQVDDGFANNNLSNTQSRDIAVNLHIAPVLSNIESSTLAYAAGQGLVNVTSTLTVSDVDSMTIAGATVTISSGLVSSDDVLGFVNQNGITGSYNAATGVLTLTGTSSVANYQAALQSVTYTDTNLAPPAGIRTVTFQVDDGFANNNLSNTQSRNISVSTHVAPVLSNIETTTLAYTAGQAPTAVTSSLTVTDSDSATIAGATVTISAGFVSTEDVLGFVSQNGISGSYNAATGVLTLTGTSSVANYQTALQSVTYSDTNLLPTAGTRTVTFQVDDGAANHNLSNTQSRNIAVARHVAPVLANIETTTLAYSAGQGAAAITATLTVTDSNSATISSATVAISAGFNPAEDVLGFAAQNGITGSYNAVSGVLTLTGVSSVANYQTALRSVTYTDTNGANPSTATRTVTFQVNDGFANNNLSNTQSRNISVSVHIAPVLANIETTTLNYLAGQAPVAITASMTATDVDSATFSSATVSITGGLVAAEDVLGFVNQNGISGSYSAATGVLTLTGVSSVANYQSALRSVTYQDTAVTPTTGTRTVSFQVNDGAGSHNLSNVQSRKISVQKHVAPVLANMETSVLSYYAGQPAVQITATTTATDSDSATLAGGTVWFTAGFAAGQDVLGFTNQNGISGTYNAATGVLTLSGVSSVANYQAALRAVTYQDTAINPSTATRTISFRVDDGFGANNLSNTVSRRVSVFAHVAPVLANMETTTLPYNAGQAATPVTATTTVTDTDSTTLTSATVSFLSGFVSSEDVLGFAAQNGITGNFNSVTGVLTLTGVSSVANYQTALRSVTYQDLNLSPRAGTRLVSFQVNDGFAVNNLSNAVNRTISVHGHGILAVSGANDPNVQVYDSVTHQLMYTLNPFGTGFSDGMRVATGDVNGDGAPDIVVAEGTGGAPLVAVYDGTNGQLIREFNPFSDSAATGAYVSVTDLSNDGKGEVVVGRGAGASGQVVVYSGADVSNSAILNASLSPVWTFTPYGIAFTGGVSVSAAVSNPGASGGGFGGGGGGGSIGNKSGFIATAPISNQLPMVEVYSYTKKALVSRFFAYSQSYTLGLTVAAGDVNGDGMIDVVTAPNDPSANAAVEVWKGNSTATSFTMTGTITPYSPTPAGGIHIALIDTTGDGQLDIVTAPGSTGGSSPVLKSFNGLSLQEYTGWEFNPGFLGGVFVG
jgi:subtilase family serine protease